MKNTAKTRTIKRQLFLTSAIAGILLTGYARQSYAACVNVGGANFICSGANTTMQSITPNDASVSTLAGFSVNSSSGSGLEIDADGVMSFTDTNASSIISTNGAGLLFVEDGDNGATPGSVTITANSTISGSTDGISASISLGTIPSGAVTLDISGDVTGTSRNGIDARNECTNGTNVSVTTATGTTIQGGQRGINAYNGGDGTTTLDISGDVTGTSQIGIRAEGRGTNLSVTTAANTTVQGATGIDARNTGSGTTTLDISGDVTGTGNNGIFASNQAASTSDLSVTTAANTTVQGTRGIYARNNGNGTTTLNISGDVTGTTSEGLFARGDGTNLSVTTATGTTVQGNTRGIRALNFGNGTTTIDLSSDIVFADLPALLYRA